MQRMSLRLGIFVGLAAWACAGWAQVPSLINYQGRVTVDGTNFNGTGQFQFALVDGGTEMSRQATATANLTGGFVTSVTVTDGGAGYVDVPAVGFSGGGGSGAAAHAVVAGGAVTEILVDNAGSGYSSPPAVAIDPPPSEVEYETYWTNGAPVSLAVTKGLYAVALGDVDVANMAALPPEVFTNADVRLRVTFDDGTHGPQQLAPDVRIAAAGYALMAQTVRPGGVGIAQLAPNSVTSGKIADGAVSNVDLAANAVTSGKIADGAILARDVDAASFSNTFWKTDGNAGTLPGTHFLGTSDGQAFEIKVDGARALRIEPDPDGSAGWAAGYAGNVAALAGTTVAGGGATGTGFLGYGPNQALAYFAAIGGGSANLVQTNADHGTIAGGANHAIQNMAWFSAIGGGRSNAIGSDATFGAIAGGAQNEIGSNATYGAIGGGFQNALGKNSDYGAIGGGFQNALGERSDYSTIGGGSGNRLQTNVFYSVEAGGRDNLLDDLAYASAIGGGRDNAIQYQVQYGVIGGGYQNRIATNADNAVVAGGEDNVIGPYA